MSLTVDLAAVLPRLREDDVLRFCHLYEKYGPQLPEISRTLYDRLPEPDQARFVTWFLKRWGKIDLINSVEKALYKATIERTKLEALPVVDVGGRAYRLRDFNSQGWDFQLACYEWVLGVHDVLYNQYEQGPVTLKPGDVIIDAGAFIGDTAVYFHRKLAGNCQIHSFELLDENLALLQHNLERNGVPDDHVVLNKMALTDRTGDEIIVAAGGSQGATSIFGRNAEGARVQTVTLDDYVACLSLQRVDFIKMDIEGAEAPALRGALQTIAHFKPRLAICLYHLWDDVITIPRILESTGVDYDYTFKWVQLTEGWEAVLLASPAEPVVRRATAAQQVPANPLTDPLAALTRAYVRKAAQADTLQRELRQARRTTPAAATDVSA